MSNLEEKLKTIENYAKEITNELELFKKCCKIDTDHKFKVGLEFMKANEKKQEEIIKLREENADLKRKKKVIAVKYAKLKTVYYDKRDKK